MVSEQVIYTFHQSFSHTKQSKPYFQVFPQSHLNFFRIFLPLMLFSISSFFPLAQCEECQFGYSFSVT